MLRTAYCDERAIACAWMGHWSLCTFVHRTNVRNRMIVLHRHGIVLYLHLAMQEADFCRAVQMRSMFVLDMCAA